MEKQQAKMTYKGEVGYMPMVGHLAELGVVIGDEFREGNVPPAARNLEFIRYCIDRMPKKKRIARFRSDSAAYQADIFNYCEEHGIEFAIGGDLDTSVQKLIRGIPEAAWRPSRRPTSAPDTRRPG